MQSVNALSKLRGQCEMVLMQSVNALIKLRGECEMVLSASILLLRTSYKTLPFHKVHIHVTVMHKIMIDLQTVWYTQRLLGDSSVRTHIEIQFICRQ